MKFSDQEISWIKDNYPSRGKLFCCKNLNRSEHSIRAIAYRLKLKSNFKFNPEANYRRGSYFRGKKRPEHSIWMKNNFDFSVIHTQSSMEKRVKKLKEKIATGELKMDKFRGHHHSEESKEKMRKKLVGRKVPKEIIKKIVSTKLKKYGYVLRPNNNNYSRCKRGYYNINGKEMYFRSLWEANYALYLDFLKNNKEISDWKFEGKTFWFEKIKRGVRSYTPDFEVINNNGESCFHEIKGWMDKKSMTKIKRMKIYFPNIKLRIIDSVSYYMIRNQFGRLLDFFAN